MADALSDETLARIIRDYWQQRGYNVDVDVRECSRTNSVEHVISYRAVRSNMRNAMPLGYSGELGVRE